MVMALTLGALRLVGIVGCCCCCGRYAYYSTTLNIRVELSTASLEFATSVLFRVVVVVVLL